MSDENPYVDPTAPPERPEPLQDAAKETDRAVASITGLITALVGIGSISAATGSLLVGLLGALFALAPIIASRISAYRTAEKARPKVTPTEDPAVVVGNVLTELVQGGRHSKAG